MTNSAESSGPNPPDDRTATPSPSQLGLDPELDACGLDLAGVLAVERYDALVPESWQSQRLNPGSRFVYVIGSAGSGFYHFAREQLAGRAHPLDECCEARVGAAARRLAEAGALQRALFYWEKRGPAGGTFADFVAIAHAAGLGARSRIGILLHPEHGPWFAIRALILTDRAPPPGFVPREVADFCSACPAPCVGACPARAVREAGIDLDRCSESRHHEPRCAVRCDARLACPIGVDSRYDSEALAHHMRAHARGSGVPGGFEKVQ